ncbi:ribonuclease P [Thioclava dalianensis]|uniref:Ribonuclease P protein component n=1 Tax=Thioclava dalianensis TaxID=1185766 RepID=A0A074TGY1_9RHOB|nr:ribonuclease P protein component [Thioclava dalianensis]KEP69400.1 ribonuclease P [Thioclava dalianensis]SFN03356.1 ribonuclease P protein component [Thioclava dalianensis]
MAAIRSHLPDRPIAVLRQRSEFLRAAVTQRKGMPGFLLQARLRDPAEPVPPGLIRIGFTCSKKLGNAVARNRAKRRLREIARAVLPEAGRPGWDYVLIGRPEATATRDFAALCTDLGEALNVIHDLPIEPRRPRGRKPGAKPRKVAS